MSQAASLLSSNSPSATSFNLDHVDKEILAGLSLQDDEFCCCSILDINLLPDEHLDDCELHVGQNEVDATRSINTDNSESRSDTQRRKHRECVARIRHKQRKSIAALQAEQTELEYTLRQMVASTSIIATAHAVPVGRFTHPAYLELVRQQIQLEDERSVLELVQEHRQQYKRLVQRELEKARTFAAPKN